MLQFELLGRVSIRPLKNLLKMLGQSPNLILTILSDQEYMSGVKEKLALIGEYR
jgi:hypothetical protein